MNVKMIGSIGAIIVVILIILIFIRKESYTNEESNDSNEIREDFPASSMNVLYSDSNGNLSSTNDLGLKNLTIASDGALQIGTKFRLYGGHDGHNNDDWLRLMSPNGAVYGGGLAADKLWSTNDTYTGKLSCSGALTAGSISTTGSLSAGTVTTTGKLSIPNYSDVEATLKNLYDKIAILRSEVDDLKANAVRTDKNYDIKYGGYYLSVKKLLYPSPNGNGTNVTSVLTHHDSFDTSRVAPTSGTTFVKRG